MLILNPAGLQPRSARDRTGARRASEAQQIFQNPKQNQTGNFLIYSNLINCEILNKILIDFDNLGCASSMFKQACPLLSACTRFPHATRALFMIQFRPLLRPADMRCGAHRQVSTRPTTTSWHGIMLCSSARRKTIDNNQERGSCST